jgi:hypothetical protein
MFFKLKRPHKKSLSLFVFVVILGLLVGVNYAYADFYGWTSRNVYSINIGWSSIASSGDGSRLVAVRSDLDNYVYVSDDYGVSWSAREAAQGTFRSWSSVAISTNGDILIVSTHEGNIYYSLNTGTNWNESNLGDSGLDFSSIAISGDGDYAYATVNSGRIWRASGESLSTWSEVDTLPITLWKSIATSDDGTKVVAVVNGGYIYTSTNGGSSWQERSNSGSHEWESVAMSSDGQTIVAVESDENSGGIYLSTNMGESWTTLSDAGDQPWSAISISDDGEVIIASTITAGVYASFNGGSTWSAEEGVMNSQIRSLALTTSGGRVALASSDSYIYTALEQTEAIITNVTSSVEDGTYIVGDIIPIQVTFSSPVFVEGTPGLSLNTSGSAPYVSGSGSSTLTFGYTVGATDETSDLDYSDTSPFQFSGDDVIRDRFGDGPIFNVPSPGSSGSLGANKDIVIDTTPPDAPSDFDLGQDNDTGISDSDGVTSPDLIFGSTLTFSATCDDNASVVSIKDNATVVATTTCSAGTATWTVSESLFPGGSYTLSATQSDSAGNESDPSSAFDLVIDSSVPALSAITPEDSIVIVSVNSIGFTVEEDNPYEGTITITETNGSADGSSPHVCYLNSNKLGTGSHTIDLSSDCSTDNSNLSPGSTYSFEFYMYDYAGNVTIVQRTNINYSPDITGPSISEETPVPSSTNDTTPDYTFTSDEGGPITYGGSCESDTIDASGGSNTITFYTLAEGEYTDCTISVTDDAGNASDTLYVSSFTVDTTPPDAPDTAPDLVEGSDTGVSNEDNITSDNTPTFTGACTDGDTVHLYSNHSLDSVGSYTCSAENSYFVTSSSLANGGHDMSIIFSDPAGNTSTASTALTITIDTTAPTTSGAPDLTSDSGVSSSDNITSGSNQTFSGSCTNGNTVQLYDDGVSSGSSDACSGGAFSLTSGTLATGVNAITFKETDTAGNVSSASTPLSVTIDTTAPTISSVSSDKANGSYTVGEVIDIDVTFSEAVQSAGNVTVTLETGTTDRTCTFSVSSVATGTCNYTVQTGDTTSDLTVSSISGTIRDIAGNSLSNFVPATNLAVNKALVIDTTAPTTPSSAPDLASGSDTGTSSTDNTTSDTTPTFTGTCTDAQVNLYVGGTFNTYVGCNSGNFSITSTALSAGVHSVTYREVDALSNESGASPALTITIDSTSPTISEVTPISTGTDTTPSYTFTTDEAGTITYGGSCSSVTTSASSGSNTITLTALAVGTYTNCTIMVTDTSSNISNTLTLTSFTISAEVTEETRTVSGSASSKTKTLKSTKNTPYPSVCEGGATYNIYTGFPCKNIAPITPGCFQGFDRSILTGEACSKNVSPQTPSLTNTPTTPNIPQFTKNLELGDVGPEVKLLQIFLNTNGFTVSTVGNGRPGFEINRFGPGTASALIRFQKANGITPAVGYFGVKTRGVVNGVGR